MAAAPVSPPGMTALHWSACVAYYGAYRGKGDSFNQSRKPKEGGSWISFGGGRRLRQARALPTGWYPTKTVFRFAGGYIESSTYKMYGPVPPTQVTAAGSTQVSRCAQTVSIIDHVWPELTALNDSSRGVDAERVLGKSRDSDGESSESLEKHFVNLRRFAKEECCCW